jgi:two-component system sensor histidine kinase BaeS
VKLVVRLVLAFVAVAALSVAVTGWLSFRAAETRIPRALAEPGVMRGAGPGGPADVAGLGARGQEVLSRQLRDANLQAAGFALVVAALVGAGVAFGLTRPLERLAQVTRRYGQGDRDARVAPRGRDEIAELGRIFDDAADRLQAEERRGRRLTSDVAHELRTPLTVLRSELEAIQDGLMPADPERIGALLEQVELLARLVDDLRTLTRADHGELSLARERVDLAASVRRSVDAFEAQARARGVTLEVESNAATLDGDEGRLRQLVLNLLDNAVRHAGARVRIEVGSDGPDVRLRVDDDGPGVPEAQREHVFERFYRVDRARQRGDGGSGLGLAIVRALAEAHGGTVRVDASPLGGARFEVRLPRAAGVEGQAT